MRGTPRSESLSQALLASPSYRPPCCVLPGRGPSGPDAAGCTRYHVAQFSLPFRCSRQIMYRSVTRSCFRRAFLFVVVFAIKVIDSFSPTFAAFHRTFSYLFFHTPRRWIMAAMSSPTLDGVVVGCWVRVGFRLWFDYTQHQVISLSTAVYRCITSHPIMTSSPRHESIPSIPCHPVCTQQLPLCNCSTSGAPALVLSSHYPLNFLGASPSTGRLRCV